MAEVKMDLVELENMKADIAKKNAQIQELKEENILSQKKVVVEHRHYETKIDEIGLREALGISINGDEYRYSNSNDYKLLSLLRDKLQYVDFKKFLIVTNGKSRVEQSFIGLDEANQIIREELTKRYQQEIENKHNEIVWMKDTANQLRKTIKEKEDSIKLAVDTACFELTKKLTNEKTEQLDSLQQKYLKMEIDYREKLINIEKENRDINYNLDKERTINVELVNKHEDEIKRIKEANDITTIRNKINEYNKKSFIYRMFNRLEL